MVCKTPPLGAEDEAEPLGERQALRQAPQARRVPFVASSSAGLAPTAKLYAQACVALRGWTPQFGAAFAGTIDYPEYGLADRPVIQFSM